MKASVFEFDNYKDYLKVLSREARRSWGSITRLSEAAGCQRSYLSRVLNADLQLTPDHLYGIAESLELSDDETEYLLTLLQIDRAASLKFKNRLIAKARRLKKQFDDLQKRVHRPSAAQDEKDVVYYSSWLFSALHIITAIPAYQTSKSIAERLQIPQAVVEVTLKQLLAWNLISFRKGKWEFANSERHIPKTSPLVTFHHQNWRQRAVVDAQNPNSEGLHFTVVQALSPHAFERIKSKLLSFIEEANAIAGPSESRRIVCLAADLFEI